MPINIDLEYSKSDMGEYFASMLDFHIKKTNYFKENNLEMPQYTSETFKYIERLLEEY